MLFQVERFHDCECDVETLTNNTVSGEIEEESNKNKGVLLLVGTLLLTSLLLVRAMKNFS